MSFESIGHRETKSPERIGFIEIHISSRFKLLVIGASTKLNCRCFDEL